MNIARRVPWVLATVFMLSLGTGALCAQQDGPPILTPTHKPKPKPQPVMVLSCDLACSWKLDDGTKGHLDAGATIKVAVEAGRIYQVAATTEDGKDKTGYTGRIESERTEVSLELKAVRDARLKAEQEERDNAAREQQANQRREQTARDEAAVAWTDSATGLMWPRSDSGDNVDLNQQQAVAYCTNLRLASHSDWRLPSISELQSISDPSSNSPTHCCDVHGGWNGTFHVKGSLHLTGAHWSSSAGSKAGENAYFSFAGAGRGSNPPDASTSLRALCVRNAGN